MFEDLDCYYAELSEEDDGIYCMSLVDEPATEVNWLMFSKERQQFTVQDEEKRLLAGAVMVADTPIYRREGDYEYTIMYRKDVILKMAEKWLKDAKHNQVDLMHNDQVLDEGKVNLVELYIKDSARGINPVDIDVPDGSLLCTYHVNDDDIWKLCKEGKFKGFSLAGFFTPKKINTFKKDTFMSKLKEMLTNLLVELEAEEKPENPIIEVLDEDTENVEESGATEVIEEQVVEETVEEEKVAEIEDTEANTEVQMAEETPVVEETPMPNVNESRLAAVEQEIDTLRQDINAIRQELAKLLTSPMAQPIETQLRKEEVATEEMFSGRLKRLYDQMHK